jgi:hypothetical protein
MANTDTKLRIAYHPYIVTVLEGGKARETIVNRHIVAYDGAPPGRHYSFGTALEALERQTKAFERPHGLAWREHIELSIGEPVYATLDSDDDGQRPVIIF